MKIKKISIVFAVVCVLSYGVFAYSSTKFASEISEINSKITSLEEQMIENSSKWEELQKEISELQEKQLSYNKINEGLREQKKQLEEEKKQLGLR